MARVLQRNLRRGRIANRIGLFLFLALLLMLVASVLSGVSGLPRV